MASDSGESVLTDLAPIYTPFIGVMGAASAIIFSCKYTAGANQAYPAFSVEDVSHIASVSPALGACYGTAKSGAAISAIGVMRPELVMKNIIPVVMAGIIAIYGLVISILIITNLKAPPEYTLFK